MAAGKRDNNSVVVGMGVSSVDGVTPVPITVDPVTGRLRCIARSETGGDANPDRTKARRDENGVATMMGQTNDAHKTPTPLSMHNGNLMIQAS